jgi:hypothetical protein
MSSSVLFAAAVQFQNIRILLAVHKQPVFSLEVLVMTLRLRLSPKARGPLCVKEAKLWV